MNNGKYRAIHVNDFEAQTIREGGKDRSLIVVVDVAKTVMYAGLGT